MKFLQWVFLILKRLSILWLTLKIKSYIPINHPSFNFFWRRYCKYCNFASRWATILFLAIFRRIWVVARFKPYDPTHSISTFKHTSLNVMIKIIKSEYETILLIIKKGIQIYIMQYPDISSRRIRLNSPKNLLINQIPIIHFLAYPIIIHFRRIKVNYQLLRQLNCFFLLLTLIIKLII